MTENKDNNDQDTQTGSAGDDRIGVKAAPLMIHAQYVKDVSFENPNAPHSLRPGGDRAKIDVDINMEANDLTLEGNPDGEFFEVTLTLTGKAVKDGNVDFVAQIEYGVVVSLGNIPQAQRHPVLMIEVPKMVFPFVRQILADLTQAGGYPPLLINPVDFHRLYLERFGKGGAPAEVSDEAQATSNDGKEEA